MYFISLIIIGSRQRSIAVKFHRASHGILAKNKYLNHALGTIFGGYTLFRSMSVYIESHVKLHHQYLGNPHKDPDYKEYIKNKLCGYNRSSKNTSKYILSILSPINTINYTKYLIKNRIYNKTEPKHETIVRAIYWVFIFFTLFYFHLMTHFVFYWIIPYITSNIWIGSLIEILEHFPDIDNDKIQFKDLYLTKNRIWENHFINFLFAISDEGYHLVHHLFPQIPAWHYKNVHMVLLKDEDYRNLDHNHKGLIYMIKNIIHKSDQ